MTEDTKEILDQPTCSVEELGKVFRLSKNPAYEAVKRGDFPSIFASRLPRSGGYLASTRLSRKRKRNEVAVLVRGADLKLLSGTRLCWRISFAATDPRPPSF